MKEVKAYVHHSRVADVIAAIKDCPAWGGDRGAHRHNLAVYVVRAHCSPSTAARPTTRWTSATK